MTSPTDQPPPLEPPSGDDPSPGRVTVVALVLALVVGALGLAAWRMSPPAVVGADAAAGEFSGERALAELEAFVGDESPRPVGSARQTEAREWLVGRFEELGWEVTEAPGRAMMPGLLCDLVNVVAEWPGEEPELPAVWLATHHDSAHAGPGVSDDAVGVAALVEVARALATDGPRRRTVRLLVTDGEEMGLLGARMAQRSLEPGGLVVNLEARGTAGPSLIFETTPGNAALAAIVADVVPRPVTSSAFVDIYRRMPNDTDFSIWSPAGLHGVNLAYVDGVQRYHTPLDDLAHLDPRSLQHHGDTTLALARAFADLADPPKAEVDAAFFDVATLGVVHWPASWTRWLALLVLAGVAVGGRRRQDGLRTASLLRALAAALGLLAMGAAVAAALAAVLTATGTPAFPAHEGVASAALALPAVGVGLLVGRRLSGHEPDADAAWVVVHGLLAVVGLVISLDHPTLTYPLVVVGLLAAAGVWLPRSWRLVGDTLPLVGCCVVVVPHATLLPDAVGATNWLAVAGPWLVVALVALPVLASARRAVVLAGGVALAAGLVALAVHVAMPAHTPDAPGHLNLIRRVTVGADGEAAQTLVAEPAPRVDVRGVLEPVGFTLSDGEWRLTLEEAAAPAPLPRIEVVEEEPGTERLTVRLVPSGPDTYLTLTTDAEVDVRVGGRVWHGRGRGELARTHLTPAADGLEVELTVPGETTLVLRETRPGLGSGGTIDATLEARGDTLVPYQWPDRTEVTVRRRVGPPEPARDR